MTPIGEEKQHDLDVSVACMSCGGRSFRRSRLRLGDVWPLLGLRYPVRCLACSMRQSIPLPVAMLALSSKLRQTRAVGSGGDGATPGSGPSAVGSRGDDAWSMPVRELMTMPDLHGVTLKHLASPPGTSENLKQ